MRFALIGDHSDGVEAACALVESGRHQLATYCGPRAGAEALASRGLHPPRVGDLEEVLADPNVEAVIVAGPLSVRSEQLKRALQSERHVLCVYPSDNSADTAYEAAMIQGDTHHALLPLLTHCLHPGVTRLADLVTTAPEGLGEIRLLEVRWCLRNEIVTGENPKLSIPGWGALRRVGGEISEVVALAGTGELSADAPVILGGRFERGGLFQMTFLPKSADDHCEIEIHASRGQASLVLPSGWQGPAHLTWLGASASSGEDHWDSWSPWPELVAAFERAVSETKSVNASDRHIWPSWHDAIRGLELDDAARRSVERGRVSTLEYQEATEEAGFKGTMTLVGCGLLWGMVFLLIMSRWLPQLGWIILPLLAVFILLQFLRWILPRRPA
jgi:predicted dehydrogenase